MVNTTCIRWMISSDCTQERKAVTKHSFRVSLTVGFSALCFVVFCWLLISQVGHSSSHGVSSCCQRTDLRRSEKRVREQAVGGDKLDIYSLFMVHVSSHLCIISNFILLPHGVRFRIMFDVKERSFVLFCLGPWLSQKTSVRFAK